MNTEKIMKELEKIYGIEKGRQVYMTIMPGILADFQKMLKKSPVGEKISEEYKLEDNKATIILRGSRKANNEFIIGAEI